MRKLLEHKQNDMEIIYHTLTVIGYSFVLMAVISKHKN